MYDSVVLFQGYKAKSLGPIGLCTNLAKLRIPANSRPHVRVETSHLTPSHAYKSWGTKEEFPVTLMQMVP